MVLKTEQHDLQQEFHKKYLEILPPKKILKLYTAERDFRMHLLRKLRHEGRGKEGRGSGSRGEGGRSSYYGSDGDDPGNVNPDGDDPGLHL